MRLSIVAILAALACVAPPARAQGAFSVIPDSLPHYTLDDSLMVAAAMRPLLVTARAVADTLPGELTLDAHLIRDRAGLAVSDLGPLLPSVRVSVNSRGETLFMLRGASERHVHAFLDGIPLTLPWDERADLSILPAGAVAGVRASRGPGSVLAGPNVLAGSVRLSLRERSPPGGLTRLRFSAGQGGYRETGLLHERETGAWNWLAAWSQRSRDAWLLPADHDSEFNQSAARERTNSDASQWSLLLRGARDLPDSGRLAVSLIGLSGRKGVQPETHLEDARFWRYPLQQRALIGASLTQPLRARLRIEAGLSLDLFDQEIREYDDARYETPPLGEGDYETDSDRTVFARAKLLREIGEGGSLALGGTLRRSRHRESLTFGGPGNLFTQRILAGGIELRSRIASVWELRADGGVESAATPDTGDKPPRDAISATAFRVSVTRMLPAGLRARAALSRRSRFPSLRELFSGALGKFEPNPSLLAEEQDLVEFGVVRRGKRGRLELNAYGSRLTGGIEKRPLADDPTRFRRVNVSAIRNLGVELIATLRPRPGVGLTAQVSLLHSRTREGESYSAYSEDRAAYLATFVCTWATPRGFRVRLEERLVGPRHSADARAGAAELARLPAQSSMNLRFGYLLERSLGPLSESEVYLRLDNLLDQRAQSQLGLPGPGRTLRAGVAMRLGD